MPETLSEWTPAAWTVIPAWEPMTVEVTVSVAEIDRVPAVLRMAENVWAPASAAVKVYAGGRDAWGSLLVSCTVPKYPLMALP